MKTASAALTKALTEGESLHPKLRVIAEWNHNRYSAISKVDNFGHDEDTYGYDTDMFPINSIAQPNRPTSGLAYARTREAMTVKDYTNRPLSRYYTASVDNKYKYWVSPAESGSTQTSSGGFTFPETTRPYVLYSGLVWTNKIYICFEKSWTAPTKYNIEITTDGTTWKTVASNLFSNAQGQVALYYQDNGTWSTAVNRDNALQIRGVRLTVLELSRSKSLFSLIELGARLESDLSDFTIDYNATHSLSEVDFVSPLGTISSNTGSLTLSNIDGRFTNDKSTSLYKGLIDSNVKFIIDVGIDTSEFGGSTVEYIRQATMFSTNWSTGDESVSVELKDGSVFLQEASPPQMLMESVAIGEAIWRMLDSVGFDSYQYNVSADDSPTVIKYFWTDGEQTVWDAMQELCRTTQSSAYFDEYGVLQIKTREAAFAANQTPVWTLDWIKRGTKQPDLVDLSVGSTYEANKVDISYTPTALSTNDLGNPVSETVWEPDGDVVLRSTALAYQMIPEQMYMWIDQKDASYWPAAGMVNIHGELIKYDGKEYKYIDKTGHWAYKIINNFDELKMVNNTLTATGQQYRSKFTGKFIITERGVDTTWPATHYVDIKPWTSNAWYGRTGGTQKKWAGGLKHYRGDGFMRMITNKTFTSDHWYTASRQRSVLNQPNYYFGTRMRFPTVPKGKHTAAGMFFHANASQNTMYAVEVIPTDHLGAARKWRNEVAVIRRANGKITYLGKGAVYGIALGPWFDLEVQKVGTTISVSLNGQVILNVTDPATDITPTANQGLYVRGHTVADFDYYFFKGPATILDHEQDNSSYLDLIEGGYYSSQYFRDLQYQTRVVKKRIGKKTVKYKEAFAERFFEEFGMQVHEVRSFDVKFESPTIYSSLYSSNQSQVAELEYTHSPFGANFVVANASRYNSVASGSDTLTFGIDNAVDQKFLITGRTVQRKDSKVYSVKNDQAIRARGEISLDISSPWIQSEAAAKSLGDWIVKKWATPADNIDVEIYANPLLQIGDVVSINYSPRAMASNTHKYWITSITSSWDSGPEMTLSLRRARI